MRYAVINGGIVANVVIYSGSAAVESLHGMTLLRLEPEDGPVGPGWSYMEGQTPRLVPPDESQGG